MRYSLSAFLVCTVLPVALEAQDPKSTVEFFGGSLASVPSELSPTPCGGERCWRVGGGVGYSVHPSFTIQGSAALVWAAGGVPNCHINIPDPQRVSGTETTVVLPDLVRATQDLSTSLRVLYDQSPSGMVSPRFALGIGRLWERRAQFWTAGAGVRVGRAQSLIIEIERTRFGVRSTEIKEVFREGEVVERLVNPKHEFRQSFWALSLGFFLRLERALSPARMMIPVAPKGGFG